VVKSVIIRAPSSTANLGPGFDVFGLALDAFYDQVKITKIGKGLKIVTSDLIPVNPQKNTAGLVAKNMLKKFKIKDGIEIEIKKGVPAGFGMGSSAASAAATAVGINKLFELNLDSNSLIEFAGMGEKASAGTVHYDNVAASVMGGFVIVRTNPLRVIRLDPPDDLVVCVAIPKLAIPLKKTKVARSVIPSRINITDSIYNLANAAAIVVGFMRKDSTLIGKSVVDIIVEPARQHMIPGFNNVKKNALNAGALGITISGAGPSVIAFTTKSSNLKKISSSMTKGFAAANIKCDVVICRPSKGANVIKN
jgi:homoserine kinase